MISLLSFTKKNRPSLSTALLKLLGLPGLVNAKDPDLGYETFLERLSFAAGINTIIQVNDCEDDKGYTMSDAATFDLETFAATGHRVGSNCLFMTGTQACDNSQYIDIAYINESQAIAKKFGKKQMNWTDTRYLGFWIKNETNSDFDIAGELQVAIVSNGVVQDKVSVQAFVDDVHQWFQIDMVAAGWDLGSVESLRFYCNQGDTGEAIYIDDILRYQISYNDAPLYGCAFPITSGTSITNGDNVRWTIDGLTQGSDSEVYNDLGMGELFASRLTGTAKRDKWVMIPGIQIFIARASAGTQAGEGLMFSGATTLEGNTSGFDELNVVKGLEAASNAGDDIFVVRGLQSTFIT